jgi:hypothetical protein
MRVYLPATRFSEEDRARWLAAPSEDDGLDSRTLARWLVRAALPVEVTADSAMVRSFDGETMFCPSRTRLRVLAGLLAFRSSIPEEVADAFVPEPEARRAAAELAEIGESKPDVRSHVIQTNWHVPLRWFAAFDDGEKILTEDRHGLRIRYETSLSEARLRLKSALSILEEAWIDEAVAGAVRELCAWLDDFEGDGMLELDYGSVARAFSDEQLLADRSAQDVWTCLDALASGDSERAGDIFGELSERWTVIRAREVMN